LRQLRELAGPDMLLEIDGGISPATISQASAAGAQLFVVGSAIFGKPDYQQAVTELTHLATPQPV
jgi:ribulose-phosphate 3-epimerase